MKANHTINQPQSSALAWRTSDARSAFIIRSSACGWHIYFQPGDFVARRDEMLPACSSRAEAADLMRDTWQEDFIGAPVPSTDVSWALEV